MNEGMSLALIAQKAGLPEGTLKSLVSRNAELQEMPYSTKAAGARVFFPAFVEWLAKHQGAEVAKVAQAQLLQPQLPSAAFLREYRLTHGVEAAKALIDEMMGGEQPKPVQTNIIALPAPVDPDFAVLRDILGDKGARQVCAVASSIAKRNAEQAKADNAQGRLL